MKNEQKNRRSGDAGTQEAQHAYRPPGNDQFHGDYSYPQSTGSEYSPGASRPGAAESYAQYGAPKQAGQDETGWQGPPQKSYGDGQSSPYSPQQPPVQSRPAKHHYGVAVDESVRLVSKLGKDLIEEVSKTVLGKEGALELVLVGVLSNGHILFEDYPGLAKTMLAKTYATTLGCKFKRIQFTPDLLPSDITGTYVFDRNTSEFKFRPGPIFTNILLADEINRAPPKTQAALLEAMEEKQVTIDGITHKLPEPFIVVATQNPIEYEGTYPLPEAQLDRFLLKMNIGYPDYDTEMSIINNRKMRRKDDTDVEVVANPEKMQELQANIENVYVDNDIVAYIVNIVRRTREEGSIAIGASPRGSLAIFKMARAMAALEGRDYVIPDDVKRIVIPALEHRVILKPEPKIKGVRSRDVLSNILMEVPVPMV